MARAQQMPAPSFPRLYDPNRTEEVAGGSAAALYEPFPLPEGGEPPHALSVATADAFGPQYLVMLHGTHTDLPLGLFVDRAEAVRFAREVRANPDGHAGTFLELIGADAGPVRHRWLSVSILEYSGPLPITRTPLFDLD